VNHPHAQPLSRRGVPEGSKAITKMPRISVRSRIAAAVVAAALAGGATLAAAGPASADGVTPAQLEQAGWACVQAHLFPALLVCFNPGQGFPPLPGTPGFADRLPSYEVLMFNINTGAFLGLSHSLRPDIYQQGTPPCPQQPSGQYFFNPFNDMWICNTLGADPAP
jgi:hypothetical protein